jgi:hypothetical protein
MFLSIFLLCSFGIVVGSFFNTGDEDDGDAAQEADEQLEEASNEGFEADAFGILPSAEEVDMSAPNEFNEPGAIPQEIQDLISQDTSGSLPENPEIVSFDISEDGLELATDPLSDWASNPIAQKIDLSETDILYFDLPPEEGSLRILRADYVERLGAEAEGDLHSFHTGANIYFIPPGEEFPEDYVWSESGASLYNSETFNNTPSDFGNIRLFVRIDTGLFYGEVDSDASLDFSERAFSELKERIASNGNLLFSG